MSHTPCVQADALDPSTGRIPKPDGLSILVVEDNEDAGTTLADLLELYGHAVRVVGSGRDGIEAIAREEPDVLICDIGLPDVPGHEVIRQARAQVGARMFAVALTGYVQPRDQKRALDAGFDAHLAKPPHLDELRLLLACASERLRAASA